MESIREAEEHAAVQSYYWELGRRIHHDRDFLDFDLKDVLNSIGLSDQHLAAYEDSSFDEQIRSRMDEGIELAGDDIGTPILAFKDTQGEKVGIFGPVITRVLEQEESIKMWDSVVTLTTSPGFWELKRTRKEGPDFGERP